MYIYIYFYIIIINIYAYVPYTADGVEGGTYICIYININIYIIDVCGNLMRLDDMYVQINKPKTCIDKEVIVKATRYNVAAYKCNRQTESQ